MLLTVTIPMGTWWVYQQVETVQPSPTMPGSGEALLTVDRPHLDVFMRVRVTDGELDFSYIEFSGVNAGETVRVAFTLSGTARLSRIYAVGEPRDLDRSGCPPSIVQTADNVQVTCTERSLQGGHTPWDPRTGELADVVILKFTADRDSPWIWTRISTDATFSTQSGDTSYFRLPTLGSTYFPEDAREVDVGIGEDRPYYVPSPLGLVLEYTSLSLGARLDSVSDAPVSTHPLTWTRSDTGSITPSGIITDSAKTPAQERGVFWLAALVGVIAGLIPLAVKAWGLAFRAWRSNSGYTHMNRRDHDGAATEHGGVSPTTPGGASTR
ncbi:MAG: hypothetical protein AAGC63_05695 [Propionicimonas sp.]|nr:hypothetical protein [Propionicimonas sp.]